MKIRQRMTLYFLGGVATAGMQAAWAWALAVLGVLIVAPLIALVLWVVVSVATSHLNAMIASEAEIEAAEESPCP